MRKFFSEVVLPAATGHGFWNGKQAVKKLAGVGLGSAAWVGLLKVVGE